MIVVNIHNQMRTHTESGPSIDTPSAKGGRMKEGEGVGAGKESE